jgi:high-affinity nickel-transport protein
MITALSIITLGFVLGMRHATDADHVVAIATIVSRQRAVRSAAWIGALWGLGHTLTIVAVGVPIVLFHWMMTPRLGLAMELAVGLMLIVLGIKNLRSHALDSSTTPHAHDHDDLGRIDRLCGGLGVYQAARPLVVGIVHGLAGSAAIALLVLTTIRDPWWALGYLLVFGGGTVAGMVLITTAIAVPFASTVRSDRTHRRLRLVTGVLSVSFGLFLTYEIAVVYGLFSAAPHWTPQ